MPAAWPDAEVRLLRWLDVVLNGNEAEERQHGVAAEAPAAAVPREKERSCKVSGERDGELFYIILELKGEWTTETWCDAPVRNSSMLPMHLYA